MTTTLDHAELRRLAEDVLADRCSIQAMFAVLFPERVLALLDKSESDAEELASRIDEAQEYAVRAEAAIAALTESLTDARREGNIARDTLRDEVEVRKAAEAERDRLRETLAEAAEAVDAAMGIIEQNVIPNWDWLREVRTRSRAALNPEREDKT